MRQRLPLVVLLALVPLLGCPKPAPPPAPPSNTTTTVESRSGAPSKSTAPSNPKAAIKATSSEDPLGIFGNPDGATRDPNNKEHFLFDHHKSIVISYNGIWNFPNWVAWHLVEKDIRSEERGVFTNDPVLEKLNFDVVTTKDYLNTGYDRGHNCPSKDRNPENGEDFVFYMSNITPQTHTMNAGPWENLESYCRKLAGEGNELYIICGHGFDTEDERLNPKKWIARGDENVTSAEAKKVRVKIAVPDFAWKIVVVLPQKRGGDIERINSETQVIAVKMPNRKVNEHDPWDNYITTVEEIEKHTGLRFFANLPRSVAEALKQQQAESVHSITKGGKGKSGTTKGRH